MKTVDDRGLAPGEPAMQAPAMAIERWLQPEHIVLDLEAPGPAAALEAAAAVVGRAHGIDPAPVSAALWRREQAGSTAMGGGLAIPHASIRGIAEPLTVFARLKPAIAFGAPDGRPVSLLLVILVPADGPRDDHLALLAAVARLLSDRSFVSVLETAVTAPAVAAAFSSGVTRVLAP